MSDPTTRPDVVRLRFGDKVALAFDGEEYEDRLDELRERMDSAGVGTCVLTAPDSIAYYSGFSGVRAGQAYGLVITEDEDVILSPFAEGARVWQHSRGDAVTYTDGAFWQGVKAVAGTGGVIGYEGDHLTLQGRDALEDHVAPVVMVDMALGVMHQQMYKSPAEVDVIRRCAALSDAGAAGVRGAIRAGALAHEVEQAGRAAMEQAGLCNGIDHAAQVRIRPGGPLQSGGMVSFDLCAQMNAYGAPLSRVLFAAEVDDAARAVWEASVAAQTFGISLLKPGVSCAQIAGQMAQHLAESGLMSLSHCGQGAGLVGGSGALDLHEDNDIVLEPDMVLSVGPVVQAVDGAASAVPYREADVVLITDDGAEVLTMCPKGPQFNVLG